MSTKIKKISVTNLKAVTELTANFDGCTAIITGANNKGKTSFLRSLADRLRGSKAARVVNDDAKAGTAEYELTSGEKFIWEFTNEKEKLTYISERNIPSKITKEISQTYFPQTFDVDKFLNDTPVNQKKVLQKLTGLDFTEVDKAFQIAYEQRTYANKRASEEKVKHESSLPDPAISKDVLPFDELQKEIEGIEVHNLKYQQVEERVQFRNLEKVRLSKDIQELEDQIKIIQQKINEKTELQKEGLKEVVKCSDWLSEEKNKPKTNKGELQLKLENIKRNNQAIELRKSYISAKENAEQADKEVKKIEQDRVEMVRLADMPDGFGFDQEGITYKGFSFNRESLSTSAIYIAALKLALLQIGEVRTLFFDASYSDKNSLKEVEEWAKSKDLQLLIERPDFEGGEIRYEIVEN